MKDQPVENAPGPGSGFGTLHAIGQIALGQRQARIVLASDIEADRSVDVMQRLELAGTALAILGTRQHRRCGAKAGLDDLTARLSGREVEIALLVAQGLANKNIAYRLRISEWTVATYLRRIYAKLNVDSRAAMVYRCAPLLAASRIDK